MRPGYEAKGLLPEKCRVMYRCEEITDSIALLCLLQRQKFLLSPSASAQPCIVASLPDAVVCSKKKPLWLEFVAADGWRGDGRVVPGKEAQGDCSSRSAVRVHTNHRRLQRSATSFCFELSHYDPMFPSKPSFIVIFPVRRALHLHGDVQKRRRPAPGPAGAAGA